MQRSLVASSALLVLSGCWSQRTPLDLDVHVVDVHAHVFNARDLPVEGFLEHSLGVPDWLAALLADGLELFTTSSDARAMERELTDEELREVMRELLERHAAGVEGVHTVEREGLDEVELMLRGILDGPAALTDDLQRARFELREAELTGDDPLGIERRRGDLFGTVACYLRWVHLLTMPSDWIAERLVETYPEVGLFTPLMMDLGPWFESSPAPARALADQLEAARGLIVAHEGRIHPFVSFDPRRQARDGSSLPLVEAALAEGFLGVKIYPPMGFRPWGNAALPDSPDDPRPPDAARLDQALDELYRFCATHDVPLAAHCSDPGAEARKGRGKRADPAFWRPVLQRYRDAGTPLRINFNHGGGLEELLDDPETSWAWTLGALIEDEGHGGVYFDVGHLDELLDDEARARLATALTEYFERFPETRRRILFGTDWHMIVRTPGHERFLEQHVRFFEEFFPELLDDFLGGNALRYLGLEPGEESRARLESFYREQGLALPAWWLPEAG